MVLGLSFGMVLGLSFGMVLGLSFGMIIGLSFGTVLRLSFGMVLGIIFWNGSWDYLLERFLDYIFFVQVHDLEGELDEERRRHQETIKILKKKERNVKELVMQCEEDHKNIQILQETLDKSYEKINIYKRQIGEQVN